METSLISNQGNITQRPCCAEACTLPKTVPHTSGERLPVQDGIEQVALEEHSATFV